MDIEVPQTTSEFDVSIQRKIEQKNNSGYLPSCYETTEDFRQVPEYYFRIEDDRTIIELQKLQRESQPLNFDFTNGSDKYQEGMNRLRQAFDSLEMKLKEAPCETHGFYDIGEEDDYDHDKAFSSYQLSTNQSRMTDEFRELSLRPKPKFTGTKIATEDKPIKHLTSKLQKLEINEY
jgi:hypothetical protein